MSIHERDTAIHYEVSLVWAVFYYCPVKRSYCLAVIDLC